MLQMSLIIGTVGACIAIIALISTGAAHIFEYLFPLNTSTIADFETRSQHLASPRGLSGSSRAEPSVSSSFLTCASTFRRGCSDGRHTSDLHTWPE
jgi:hypothetical protein